jgi:hypothetical protein
MSGGMPHESESNASSSSPEVSDAGSADKIEDSDDDGSQQPSPSLFRQEQADENADASQDDDGSDNESDDGSEGPLELCSSHDEEDALSNSTPVAHSAAAVSHESIFARFIELTRQFAALFDQNQKLDLMFCKSASKSLNFDSQKRNSVSQYAPKYRAPQSIPATQEDDDFDFERDSVCSSSSRSTRIRLQEEIRVIDIKPTNSSTP